MESTTRQARAIVEVRQADSGTSLTIRLIDGATIGVTAWADDADPVVYVKRGDDYVSHQSPVGRVEHNSIRNVSLHDFPRLVTWAVSGEAEILSHIKELQSTIADRQSTINRLTEEVEELTHELDRLTS